jgi:hypothetical protein
MIGKSWNETKENTNVKRRSRRNRKGKPRHSMNEDVMLCRTYVGDFEYIPEQIAFCIREGWGCVAYVNIRRGW